MNGHLGHQAVISQFNCYALCVRGGIIMVCFHVDNQASVTNKKLELTTDIINGY